MPRCREVINMKKDIRITVLYGGPSAERAVSLVSGAAVAAMCRGLGYGVTEADISPADLGALETPADVVFPVLHGSFGEDGQLQAILERRELCYVGSDAAASRLAIDKDAAKHCWQRAGLPTAAWLALDAVPCPLILAPHFPLPAVVKPAAEGSSVGVRLCDTMEDLQQAVLETGRAHGKVLIERRLAGPELTVGILGDAALPVIQVKPAATFYDYEAKYHRDDTVYLFKPEIDRGTYQRAQAVALDAFHALGCRDYGRVDLIVDETTGLQLLEINTIPGFTGHSLFPKAAARAGIAFGDLVDRLVRMALQRKQGCGA